MKLKRYRRGAAKSDKGASKVLTIAIDWWYYKIRELTTECVSIGVDAEERVRRRDAVEPCVGFLL